MLASMPKRTSLGRLSRRSLAKGKCKIENAISELSLATVCSSADLSDFVDESVSEDSPASSSSFISDCHLPKQGSCMSCCPSCCYPLLEASTESSSASHNVAKAFVSHSPPSMDHHRNSNCGKNCITQTQDSVPQHILLEYVKGLQDANKSRDADTAERLLQELGECLNSLSSASTVVSAGGARAVASTLKLFRYNSLQKSSMDTSDDAKSGISKIKSDAGIADSISGGERKPFPMDSQAETPYNSNECVQLKDTSFLTRNTEFVPIPGSVAAEVGKKRQRTVEGLDEGDLSEGEEMISDTSDCDLCVSTETFLSSSSELPKVMDTVQETSRLMCAEASGEGRFKIAEQGGALQVNIPLTSILDARCISNPESPAMIKFDSNKAGSVAELQSSHSFELANGGGSVLGQHQSDLSVDGSLVSGADGLKLIMERPETSLSSKKFATDAFVAPCPTGTINRKTQAQISESNTRFTDASQGDCCHIGGSRENRERQKYCEQSEHQDETEENCLTKLSFDGTVFKDITRKHCRGEHERINADEKVTKGPSVLSFSKGAGLTDVVFAGCFVLERLLNVVLQGKGCSRTRSSNIAGSERRGKSLRAEMYVALTEAFVEILQPLQDIFSMLMWCLDCLAYILPPCTSETCMGYSSVQNAVASCLNKELRKPLTEGEEYKVQTASKSGTQSIPKDQGKDAPKSRILSFSDAVNNGTCKSQAGAMSLSNQPYNEIGAESAASSISALAAVAYSATVPMLAEKAVKGILLVLHPRNIDSESTIAVALRALSAHLSSVTSKSLCDDAFAFIIAAMKEFLSSPEVQIQGFTAISSLVKALNSTMGHAAWVAVTASMVDHRTNLLVQRAGCSTLQMLCAKTAIGHSEWSNEKRPLRASKDSDREGGARALISAMFVFPQDVRIQWYACSTMWNLVHCAGIKSVLAMVNYGAVMAVVGAMAVCRTNEVVQHEGCNVLGTMAKTLAENGFKFDHVSRSTSVVDAAVNKVAGRCGTVNSQNVYKENKKVGVQHDEMKGSATVDDWWAALWAVVGAMKAFTNSESVQSYGTYALGCMLKVFTEAVPSGSSFDVLSSSDLLCNSGDTKCLFDSREEQSGQWTAKQNLSVLSGIDMAFTSNVLDSIGELHTVVEIVMAAMREFPKIETVQIWGCAVLQQAFPAYIQLTQRMFQCSNDKEDGVLDVGHDSNNASLCFLQSQVRDLYENDKKVKSLVLGVSATDHTRVFLKESNRKTYSKFSSTEKESLTASISKCSGELSCGAVVGDAIDSHADNICSQYTTAKSCQLESSKNSQSIHMSSFSCQEEALVSKVEETMHPRGQHCDAFVDIILSQATSAISLISEAVALDINDTQANDDTCSTVSNQHSKASPRLFGSKFTSVKFQCGGGSTKSIVSIRHSWFAALGVLGDVFCDLAKHLESFTGRGPADRSVLKEDIGQPRKASENSVKMLNTHLDLRNRFLSKGDSDTHEEVHDKPLWGALSLEKYCTGLPLLLKTAIIAVLNALSKIKDVDTVNWALQALPNLYTAWGTVCMCLSGVENHQEMKKTLWGDGDVGVKNLVDLLSHWTEQSRLDVMILALHAIYCACNSIATVHEIEDVFGLGQCGMLAVLGALRKALSPSVSIQERRKLIQLSCYVLSAICSYSVCSQISFATIGGADLVIAALVRYGDEEQAYASGLQALGIDSQSKPDFSKLLNAAVSRNMTASSGKCSRRKRNGSIAGNAMIGLKHVFKESTVIGSSSASKLPSKSDVSKDRNESGRYKKEKWTPELKRLLNNRKEQMGVLQTLLIASPGCGGPMFAVELLKSLNEESQRGIITAEAQAHVCKVISYMADSDSNWRKELISEGAIEAVLLTMEFAFGSRNEEISSFHMIRDGVDVYMEPVMEIQRNASEPVSIDRENQVPSGEAMISEKKALLDASVQCAACWALANLAKDLGSYFSTESLNMIQAAAAALRRYGGLAHQTFGSTKVLSRTEVCIPARLVLARLGVTRIGNQLISHKASEAGDIMCLEALVSKGVDISVLDDSGRTALWHAEKSGHTHILHYLRTHAHSHGRRRARGKAISKCKRGNQEEKQHENENSFSVNQYIGNAQLEEIESSQKEHILNTASCISNVSTKNSEQTDLKTEENPEKSESGKRLPNALGIESICDENLVKSEVDTVVQEIAMKNAINILKKQKNHKKNRKVHTNHREESGDKAIIEKHCLDAVEGHASGQVNDATTVEESASLEGEMDAKQLNLMLREAMASGNIEKLEVALRTCTSLGCSADKDLVKKVKAALQKRLKRMEKCVALDNELCSAMKEGNKCQLNAAIAEIESVPRFAAALQENLNAARQELNNIEMRERLMVTDIHIASECSSEMDELPSVTKQGNIGATEKIVQSVVLQGKEREFGKNMVCSIDVESKTKNALIEVSTCIQPNTCFKNAVSNDRTVNKVAQIRSKSNLYEDVNNNSMNGTMLSKLGNIQRAIPRHLSIFQTESEGEFQRMPVSQCQMISSEQVQSVQNASHEATPLLGTLHVSRSRGTCQSVIKPPHPKNPLTMESTEHYPITSQLFPVSGGAPLGYGSHVKKCDIWSRDAYFENLRSFKGSFADTSEFVSTPNYHADTYFDFVQQEPQVSDFDEPGYATFSPMWVPSLFRQSTMENQSLGSLDDAPDELSSPWDSFLPYWNPPNMKSQSYSFLFPAEPIGSINHQCSETDSERYISDSFKCNNHHISGGPSSEHMDHLSLHIQDQLQNNCGASTAGLYSFSRVVAPPPGEPLTGPACDRLANMLNRVSLNDAYIGETCSICQQTTKDAALVPCGHYMCKVCADNVQLINCHCPICNRFISSIHSLY